MDTPVIKCGGPFVVAMGWTNKNVGIQLFDYTKQSGVVKTSSKLLISTHFQYTYKDCKHGKFIADAHVTPLRSNEICESEICKNGVGLS